MDGKMTLLTLFPLAAMLAVVHGASNHTCDPNQAPEKGGKQLLCLPKDYDKLEVRKSMEVDNGQFRVYFSPTLVSCRPKSTTALPARRPLRSQWDS